VDMKRFVRQSTRMLIHSQQLALLQCRLAIRRMRTNRYSQRSSFCVAELHCLSGYKDHFRGILLMWAPVVLLACAVVARCSSSVSPRLFPHRATRGDTDRKEGVVCISGSCSGEWLRWDVPRSPGLLHLNHNVLMLHIYIYIWSSLDDWLTKSSMSSLEKLDF